LGGAGIPHGRALCPQKSGAGAPMVCWTENAAPPQP